MIGYNRKMNFTKPTGVCIMNPLLQLPQKHNVNSLVLTYKTKLTGNILWKAKISGQLNAIIVTYVKQCKLISNPRHLDKAYMAAKDSLSQ